MEELFFLRTVFSLTAYIPITAISVNAQIYLNFLSSFVYSFSCCYKYIFYIFYELRWIHFDLFYFLSTIEMVIVTYKFAEPWSFFFVSVNTSRSIFSRFILWVTLFIFREIPCMYISDFNMHCFDIAWFVFGCPSVLVWDLVF